MPDEIDKDKLAELTIGAAQGNPFAIRALKIMGQEMQFAEGVWSEDEKFWDAMKKDPVKMQARMRMHGKFLSIFAVPRLPAQQPSAKRESAESIAGEGLSDKEIEAIAFGGDEKGSEK